MDDDIKPGDWVLLGGTAVEFVKRTPRRIYYRETRGWGAGRAVFTYLRPLTRFASPEAAANYSVRAAAIRGDRVVAERDVRVAEERALRALDELYGVKRTSGMPLPEDKA